MDAKKSNRILACISTKKDVLLVHQGPIDNSTDPQDTLKNMGFKIEKKIPSHWILRIPGKILEIHFYSELELRRFISGRAAAYAYRSGASAEIAQKTVFS